MRHHLGADYSTPNRFVVHRNEVLTEQQHPIMGAVIDKGVQFAHAVGTVGKSAIAELMPHRPK